MASLSLTKRNFNFFAALAGVRGDGLSRWDCRLRGSVDSHPEVQCGRARVARTVPVPRAFTGRRIHIDEGSEFDEKPYDNCVMGDSLGVDLSINVSFSASEPTHGESIAAGAAP